MSERSVRVRYVADMRQFLAAHARAANEVDKSASKSARSAERGADAVQKALDHAARGAVTVGLAMGASAKAAIDWESAWAGVTKSVDGATPQMEAALRGLAKTLPATHDEIAAVAEAAGQLGVKSKDVVGFTTTMIKLGETTNLSADEAATSIAQISNVMGTMDRLGTDGVDRFAAALVHLGNNGASTERDIVAMASRIAGAAKVVGLSEPDLLAVSNALASVGIEAEAGGTAFSSVLIDMSKAVKTGNEDLVRFAEVAGMTTQEFARAFEERPAQAVNAFTQGLGRIKASGGDVFTVLDELGQSDVRVTSALLKMAGAGDLLSTSLDDGQKAWAAGSAAQDEFAKRAETTAAKMQVARNNIRDAAITIGDSMGPAIVAVSEAVSDLAGLIASIPAPIRNAGLVVGGLGAAGILAAAGIAKVVGVGRDFSEALTAISARGPRTEAAISRTGAAAARAGKAFAAAAVAGVALSALEGGGGEFGLEQMRGQLEGGADAAELLDSWLGKTRSSLLGLDSPIKDVGSLMRVAFDPSFLSSSASSADKVFSTLSLGMVNLTSDADDVARQIGNIDALLSRMVSAGDADEAAEIFALLGDEATRYGGSIEQLRAKLPAYAEALAASSNQARAAAAGTDEYSAALELTAGSAEKAQAKLSELVDTIKGLDDQMSGARATQASYQAAIDDATASFREHGKTVNRSRTEISLTTEAGRANDAALRDLAATALDLAANTYEMTGSVKGATGAVESGRSAFIRQAQQMGLTKEAAARYADQLGLIPKNVRTLVTADTAGASSNIRSFETLLTRINGRVVRTRIVTENVSTYGGLPRADGGFVEGRRLASGGVLDAARRYADGGGVSLTTGQRVPRVSQILSGGMNILWQEPETGWETYISGKPSMRRRNMGIWAETGRRLGIDDEILRAARVRHAFADGGYVRSAPSVTSPAAERMDARIMGREIADVVAARLGTLSLKVDRHVLATVTEQGVGALRR